MHRSKAHQFHLKFFRRYRYIIKRPTKCSGQWCIPSHRVFSEFELTIWDHWILFHMMIHQVEHKVLKLIRHDWFLKQVHDPHHVPMAPQPTKFMFSELRSVILHYSHTCSFNLFKTFVSRRPSHFCTVNIIVKTQLSKLTFLHKTSLIWVYVPSWFFFTQITWVFWHQTCSK